MKHCHKAGPVALSKPWSALWTHTPTSAPPRHTREKSPKVRRVCLEKARWWERESERKRKLLTSTPPSCKSKLHLLTAFMIRHNTQMSENCHNYFQGEQQARSSVYSCNRSRWLYAVRLKAKERSVCFPTVYCRRHCLPCQLTAIQFNLAPFQTGPHLCRSSPCTPPLQPQTHPILAHWICSVINPYVPVLFSHLCAHWLPVRLYRRNVLRVWGKRDCILSREDRSSVVWKQVEVSSLLYLQPKTTNIVCLGGQSSVLRPSNRMWKKNSFKKKRNLKECCRWGNPLFGKDRCAVDATSTLHQ